MSRSSRINRHAPRPIVKPKAPLWKKASIAAGVCSALGIAGLVYLRSFWGRNDITERAAKFHRAYAEYDPQLWKPLEEGQTASQSKPADFAPMYVPAPIPNDRLVLSDAILKNPAIATALNGEELPPAPVFRIEIPAGTSISEVREAASAAPLPDLGVSSTNEIDPRPDGKKIDLSATGGNVYLENYAQSFAYLLAYGIPVEEAIKHFPKRTCVHGPVLGFFGAAKKKLPPLWSAVFRQGNREAAANFYFPNPFNDTWLSGVGYWDAAPVVFIQHYAQAIDGAAAAVARAHPDLRLPNLRVFLRWRLLKELGNMGPEDVWQDRAACHFADCPLKADFDAVSLDPEIAVGATDPIFGKVWDFPNPVWRFLSWTYKYNLERQGLGPAQNIIGLARKAGRDPALVRRYAPVLSPADFKDSKAIVRAVLDPTKAIYIRAMTLDLILGELKRTLFLNPKVTYPSNQPPFISDPRTAREFGLLFAADILWVLPETENFLPQIMTGSAAETFHTHTELFASACFWKIPLEFPGMLMPSFQLDERTFYFPDYQMAGSLDN